MDDLLHKSVLVDCGMLYVISNWVESVKINNKQLDI